MVFQQPAADPQQYHNFHSDPHRSRYLTTAKFGVYFGAKLLSSRKKAMCERHLAGFTPMSIQEPAFHQGRCGLKQLVI